MTDAQFREWKRGDSARRQEREYRQFQRDLAWSRWARQNGVADRVRVEGDTVTVSRGMCPGGTFKTFGKAAW